MRFFAETVFDTMETALVERVDRRTLVVVERLTGDLIGTFLLDETPDRGVPG